MLTPTGGRVDRAADEKGGGMSPMSAGNLPVSRRGFLLSAAASGLVAVGGVPRPVAAAPAYSGPNVIVVRFGGGVRRRETIDPTGSRSPFLLHEFIPQGTLFPCLEISQRPGLNTSHGEGTLNIVTGHYDSYEDVDGRFLGTRFEPNFPTLFEYLRKAYAVAPHETLMINGEDRPDEEFYNFSNSADYGAAYRCSTLSLYRYYRHRLERKLAAGGLSEAEIAAARRQLEKWESGDRRLADGAQESPAIARFWDDWQMRYVDGASEDVRGDRLLTEIAVRALRHLRPRLLMVNYQDCDFVHWGNAAHYTRGIAVMDQGLRDLAAAVEADEFYRGNTVFAVVPDCGRDDNPMMAVPYQHHFNSRSAREIFALLVGPGIARGRVVDRSADQTDIAPTVAALMGFAASESEGAILREAFA